MTLKIALMTSSQALLTSTITDMKIQVNNKPELIPIEYEEVDNDDTLMIEPELANKNIEFLSDEDFEKEIGSQIQNEWEIKDKERYNYMDNDLTTSNNIEIQNWVLKFDSAKKVHVSSKTSTENFPKAKETPLLKPQSKPTDMLQNPKPPQA